MSILSDLKRKGSEILKKTQQKTTILISSENDIADDVDGYYDLDIENLGPDQPGNVFVDNEETHKEDTK